MRFLKMRAVVASLAVGALMMLVANEGSAQCSTCPTPVVAYSPVVAQPVVAVQPSTGWYPGRMFDNWRLRRAANRAAYSAAYAPTYSAAYAPTYSAAYAPTYTAAYAPTYTAAYAPTAYTASYAPTYTVARPYVTAYAPLSAPASAPCTGCAQTVARQVVMQPVVAAPACATCSYTPDCGCDACSGGVSQAVYTEPGCSSCAASSSAGNYGSSASGSNVGPQTPPPTLAPVPEPARSQYESKRQIQGNDSEGDASDVLPATSKETDPLDEYDPRPAAEEDSSTYYNAPRLLDPRDRTARANSRKPTVGVWNAVYRKPTTSHKVSHTNQQTVARTQAEIDADGWSAVAPGNR